MVKAFGKVYMAIRTSANGDNQKLQVMVSISGRMAIGTRESGRIVSNMDKAQISLQMVTVTPAYMLWESPMVKASTSGKTAAFI